MIRSRPVKDRYVTFHEARVLVILAVLLPAPLINLASEATVPVFNCRDWALHTLLCVAAAERFIDRSAINNTWAMAADSDPGDM
jgi:hypothetical protein